MGQEARAITALLDSTEHRGQSDGIVSLRGPIIQDPFPCAELQQAARVSVVILSEDSLKWALGAHRADLGVRLGVAQRL